MSHTQTGRIRCGKMISTAERSPNVHDPRLKMENLGEPGQKPTNLNPICCGCAGTTRSLSEQGLTLAPASPSMQHHRLTRLSPPARTPAMTWKSRCVHDPAPAGRDQVKQYRRPTGANQFSRSVAVRGMARCFQSQGLAEGSRDTSFQIQTLEALSKHGLEETMVNPNE